MSLQQKKTTFFGWPGSFKKQGPFLSNHYSPKTFFNVIDYTRRMNNLRWNGMKKKYINNIIRYDYKNKHLIKILKNILKNTSRTIK